MPGGSIHSGEVSAHEVTRMISRDGQPTRLGQAIAHFGRIFKTLHLLRLVDDEPYRREIKAQTNLTEGRHDLGRKIFHGRKGEMYRQYFDGMEDQLSALGARPRAQLRGAVEHRLPRPSPDRAARRRLPGARLGRSAVVAVHPRPHRYRRALQLPSARPRRSPPAAAQPGRLRRIAFTAAAIGALDRLIEVKVPQVRTIGLP